MSVDRFKGENTKTAIARRKQGRIEKLREEFKTCRYAHSGAYGRLPQPPMQQWLRDLDDKLRRKVIDQ